MSTSETAPPSPPGGIRGFADRQPFRRKLNLLVGVPLTVVAALLAYLITDQVGQSREAADAARLVRTSTQVATLVDRLEAEHQQAILLSVRHEATPNNVERARDEYRKAQLATDAQVDEVREAFGSRLPEGEERALRDVESLDSLRRTIEQGYLPADNIDPAYTSAAKAVIDGLGLDRNAALASTFTGNMLDSLLRADAAHSAFETGVFSATTGDSNALIEFIGAVGSYDEYTHQAERFARFATEKQAEELAGIEHSAPQGVITRQYAELQIDPSALQAETPADIRAAFRKALDSYPEYRKQAEIRLGITTSLIGQIADRADQASDDALRNAVLLLSLAILGFVLWLAFSVLVRRSVLRPVQELTAAAHDVAEATARELARVAEDDTDDETPAKLRKMPVTARDEIGDLANAFNHVQTTAAALLERQVLSRRNVAEMFGNVGRRVSNLTTRQLALIDAVERGETDPVLLERLYRIDHIAVRLRRNADSLMLLAGIREPVVDAGPMALTNVVRAALSQIEGYQRVQLLARTELMVAPDIVGDLTLLVAELIENAVSFSPKDSPVEVFVQNSADGAAIVIADHGIGMDPERLEEENARLVRRERLDLVPSKVLGLFVVGTLARRWRLDVVLSRTPGGGVTAEVSLPQSLLRPPAEVQRDRTPTLPPSDGAGPRRVETDDAAGPLPRRVRRDDRHDRTEDAAGAERPSAPRARTAPDSSAEQSAAAPSASARSTPSWASGTPAPQRGSSGAPPLRRRVRGATLRQTAEVSRAIPREAPKPADAEAVRSALEEFEAAVERANRDAASKTEPTTPRKHDQNDLPEGAEQ